MAIIGIDLGTTNSLASVWKNGKIKLIPNAAGDTLTPSCVSINDEGEVIVGSIAKERAITHPTRTALNFKQFMGTKKAFRIGDDTYYPEDLSALVLRRIKEDAEIFLGEEVTEAVISVPAYFNDHQRSATQLAGKLAGLKVERIINEPSAAAIAYKHQLGEDGLFLVFDFGGGTLDVSIVDIFENIVDILSVAGDNHLGGNDINQLIVDYFFSQHPTLEKILSSEETATLFRMAEEVKRIQPQTPMALMSVNQGGQSYSISLTNEDLMKICIPLFERIRKVVERALRDSRHSIQQIDEIIMIGGSCKMPLIQQYVEHITGKKPLTSINPDKAVATGIGLVSGIKERKEGIKDVVLTDICPFTLGIAVVGDRFSPIINRNASLPTSNEGDYVSVNDGQKIIQVDIYQGEHMKATDNLLIGQLLVGIPPLPAGEVVVSVRFSYDINGVLQVEAENNIDDKKAEKVIVSNQNLSPQEVEERLKKLQELASLSRENEVDTYLISLADRLYMESIGPQREPLASHLARFKQVLKGDRYTDVLRGRKEFKEFLENFQVFDDGLSQ